MYAEKDRYYGMLYLIYYTNKLCFVRVTKIEIVTLTTLNLILQLSTG